MNFGLLQSALQDVEAYITGSGKVPYIYFHEGNWEPWLPKYEPQAENYETCGCTVWGAQNQIEILSKYLYGKEPNFSERYNCALEGIRCPGVDPQITYENIRTYGLVDADVLPIPKTYAEFIDTSAVTGSILAKGQNWLLNNEFKHEWLWNSRPLNYMEVLEDAVRTSPIGISVDAWHLQGDEYVSTGGNNHWCVLYKFEDGHPWVFDTYDHSTKKLSKTHDIRLAKRIWLQRKDIRGLTKQVSLLTKLLNALLMRKTLLQVCKENLGRDASPADLAPDEVGCAETVTTILKQVYPETPILTGTYSLLDYLRNPKNGWKQIDHPEPEAIILCATGTGNGSIPGHTGFCDENLNIMSNDSKTGKFLTNYTLKTWRDRYVLKGDYKIYYFKK